MTATKLLMTAAISTAVQGPQGKAVCTPRPSPNHLLALFHTQENEVSTLRINATTTTAQAYPHCIGCVSLRFPRVVFVGYSDSAP